jgi:hypothetical protein
MLTSQGVAFRGKLGRWCFNEHGVAIVARAGQGRRANHGVRTRRAGVNTTVPEACERKDRALRTVRHGGSSGLGISSDVELDGIACIASDVPMHLEPSTTPYDARNKAKS